MKKSLLILTLIVANAHAYNKWSQPDDQKPKQTFDYFIGGDDEISYIQLDPQAKNVLKKMLTNAQEDEKLDAVINRVQAQVKTNAGQEALKALQEMAQNDPELTAGVVLDNMFDNGKMMQKQHMQKPSQQKQMQK